MITQTEMAPTIPPPRKLGAYRVHRSNPASFPIPVKNRIPP